MLKRQLFKGIKALTLSCIVIAVLSCDGADSARGIWREIVKKCVRTDFLGRDVLYFGPSTLYGPGTITTKFRSGATQPLWLVESYLTADQMKDIIKPETKPGDEPSCSLQLDKKFSMSADLPLALLNLPGNINAELSRAKNVKITIERYRFDDLVTGPYRKAVKDLADSDQRKVDIVNEKHKIVTRSIFVKNMQAQLEFEAKVGGEVKKIFPEGSDTEAVAKKITGATSNENTAVTPQSAPTAQTQATNSDEDAKKDDTPNFGIHWEGTTKLTLDNKSEFYLGGEEHDWNDVGLSGGPGGKEEIGPLVKGTEKIKFVRPGKK